MPLGLQGTGAWVSPGFSTLGWVVSQAGPGLPWHYVYSLGVPGCNISQFIVQTSPDFSLNDITNVSGQFSSYTVGTFTPGSSFPNLPGQIYGVLVTTSGPGGQFAFDSPRVPVWGDFYAQGTNSADSVRNVGFGQPNPDVPPANGALNNSKLLVPDTVAVPDANTAVLALFGLLPAFLVRRRRRTT